MTSEPALVLGADAWRIVYHSTLTGVPTVEVYTLLIRGRDGYWIGTIGPQAREADVIAFHDLQLTTFELLDR